MLRILYDMGMMINDARYRDLLKQELELIRQRRAWLRLHPFFENAGEGDQLADREAEIVQELEG